jgi:hypothetical protein
MWLHPLTRLTHETSCGQEPAVPLHLCCCDAVGRHCRRLCFPGLRSSVARSPGVLRR